MSLSTFVGNLILKKDILLLVEVSRIHTSFQFKMDVHYLCIYQRAQSSSYENNILYANCTKILFHLCRSLKISFLSGSLYVARITVKCNKEEPFISLRDFGSRLLSA